MNKKEKRIALLSALSSKVADNKIVVLDAFNLDEVKTKKFAEVMSNLKVDKALVVIEGENKNVVLSGRNIPTVKVSATNEINTYDVLKYETLVVTKAAVEKFRGGVCIMANVQYYDVILKPVITEKSMADMADKKYTFLVHTDANKTMIKDAVEKMFEGTKVASVNTMNLDGKKKRRGRTAGTTSKTKKAIVQLTADSKEIEIFEGL